MIIALLTVVSTDTLLNAVILWALIRWRIGGKNAV